MRRDHDQVRAETRTRQTVNPTLVLFPLLLLLVLFMAAARPLLNDLSVSLPSHSGPAPGPGRSWELETVYAPSIHLSVPAASQAGTSGPTVSISPEGMPDFPDCRELGFECDRWDVNWEQHGKNDVINVELKAGDRTIGQAQLMRVQVSEFDEISHLARFGIQDGWMGHIQVIRLLRNNGIGHVMWKAADAALAAASGGGVVRIVYDTAGWGHSLMRHVPADWFVVKDAPLWVYVIP